MIIVSTAKVAGILLFVKRDTTSNIDIDVDDIRREIREFNSATLTMAKTPDDIDIVNRCVEVNEHTKRLYCTSNYAQAVMFVYLLELSALFKEANASEDHQKLNRNLQEEFKIKKAPQYSKFRRKSDGVKKILRCT